MSQISIDRPDAVIGNVPVQYLHVVDDRDLKYLENNGFSIYLSLVLALIPTGLGIGATIFTCNLTSDSKDFYILGTTWGLVFFIIALVLLSIGVAFLVPAIFNMRSTKSLISEIRNRSSVPPVGQQQRSGECPELEPVIRSQ